MGLIFASLKTHFSNVVFCTFSLTLEHTDFHFSFEILDHMMRLSAFLCGDCVTGHLDMETMTASKKSTCAFLENFVINDLV